MHYQETQVWDRSGRFSGAGIGVGTGGLGVGIGGGTYSEQGTIATKRAEAFAEPTPYLKPVVGCVVLAFVVAASIQYMPTFLDLFGSDSSGGALNGGYDTLRSLMPYLIPVMVLLTIVGGLKNAWENQADNDRTLAVDYPRLLERYNELRYCARCHVLFDHQGNAEPANSYGFDRMLAIEPTSRGITA